MSSVPFLLILEVFLLLEFLQFSPHFYLSYLFSSVIFCFAGVVQSPSIFPGVISAKLWKRLMLNIRNEGCLSGFVTLLTPQKRYFQSLVDFYLPTDYIFLPSFLPRKSSAENCDFLKKESVFLFSRKILMNFKRRVLVLLF